MTLNEIRYKGFWIINGNAAVRSYCYHCVTCRKLRGKLGKQKMADLPEERSRNAAPLTCIYMDMFRPFVTKEGRKELKCFAATFTCFASQAIDLEVVKSIDTDSFIMCLQRFIGRRGNVRILRSDSGGKIMEQRKSSVKTSWKWIKIKLEDSCTIWVVIG